MVSIGLIALTVVAGSFVWFRQFAWYPMAALAAVMAALGARKPSEAAVCALLGMAIGSAGIHVSTVGPWHSFAAWALFAAKTGVPAAALAWFFVWSRPRCTRVSIVLPWMGLALVVIGSWMVVIALASSAYGEGGMDGTGLIAWLNSPPKITATSPDEALYHAYVKGIAEGRGYYATAQEALVYQNQIRPAPIDTGSPSAFREPWLYVLLGRLGVGWPLVFAALCLMTLALVSAFLLAREFSSVPAALSGTALLASFLVDYVSTYTVLGAEIWAGMLVLCAIAVASLRPRSARFALWQHAVAAGFAFLAATTREIAVPVFAIGLAATLSNPALRKAKAWAPWVVGLAGFGVVFGVHLSMVRQYLVPVPGIVTRPMQFFDPSGRALYATVQSVQHTLQFKMWATWMLMSSGVAGPLVTKMGRTRRILIAGLVIGGLVALTFFHSPGFGLGQIKVPTHWALLVIPTILACTPLALAPWMPAEEE